jgi:hypothetical protein
MLHNHSDIMLSKCVPRLLANATAPLSIITFSIMTLSIMTLSIMTLI